MNKEPIAELTAIQNAYYVFLVISNFLSSNNNWNVCRDEQERLRKIEAEMRAAEEAKKREMERQKQEEEHRRL